jgi:hypothetical protein
LDEVEQLGIAPIFHLTLVGYGHAIESANPSPKSVVRQFERLSERYGRERVIWRYDPILFGSEHDAGFHEQRFQRLAQRMKGIVSRCVMSLLDPYPSTLRGLARVSEQTGERFADVSRLEVIALAQRLVAIGASCGIEVSACCEQGLVDAGVARGRCIDPDLVRLACGDSTLQFKDAPTRKGCGCVQARDIGAYDTCAHGCSYCYANASPERGAQGVRLVEPTANHLGAGDLEPTPRKREAAQLELALGGRRQRTS